MPEVQAKWLLAWSADDEAPRVSSVPCHVETEAKRKARGLLNTKVRCNIENVSTLMGRKLDISRTAHRGRCEGLDRPTPRRTDCD